MTFSRNHWSIPFSSTCFILIVAGMTSCTHSTKVIEKHVLNHKGVPTPLPEPVEKPVVEVEKPDDEKPVVEVEKPSIHIVQKGESYWSIARKYKINPRELIEFNNAGDNAILQIDAKVRIPGNMNNTIEMKMKNDPVPEDGKYIVRAGDSLWRIARQFGLHVKDIKELNNLQNDIIHVGDVLILREQEEQDEETTPNKNVDNSPEQQPLELPKGYIMYTHHVQAGDKLEKIARVWDSTEELILQFNSDIKTDQDLKPGIVLKVPVPTEVEE